MLSSKLANIAPRFHVEKRHMLYGALMAALLLVSSVSLIKLSPYSSSGHEHYFRAKVVSVQGTRSAPPGSMQSVRATLLDGPTKGSVVTVQRVPIGDAAGRRLPTGSEILLARDSSMKDQYSYMSRWYMPGVGTLFTILLLLVIGIGAWRGLTSIFGLAISIAILAVYVVPSIVQGHNAFVACIVGAVLITLVSLFIAHGFTKRTTVAFIGSMLTLAVVVGLTAFASYATGTSEVIDENNVSVLYAAHPIDLGGLLTGGVVIASLGALFDITTGQAATVDEIHKADHKLSMGQLFWKGMSVGREHIAALINTLGLVYVGVALPAIVTTIVLNQEVDYHAPLLVNFNTETLAEEVVRTCVASIGMLLALPVTTLLAAYLLPRWTPALGKKLKRLLNDL